MAGDGIGGREGALHASRSDSSGRLGSRAVPKIGIMQETTASEAELAVQERANEGLNRDVERFERRTELQKEARFLILPTYRFHHCRLYILYVKICPALDVSSPDVDGASRSLQNLS